MPVFQLNKSALSEAINRTGFPTEYKVQELLESRGWQVISNRYYIDDQKKIEREIDLVATKNGIKLVISCKKSDTEFWAFMTSENPGVDVPFEYKTDDRVVNYFWDFEQDTLRHIIERYPNLSQLLTSTEQVRAFQQIVTKNYLPNNDKQIYDSIITTIKAAEYEGAHSQADIAYFMISIFEGELVKYDFDTNDSITIDDIKYVNRHFIGNNDRYYCVHFIKYAALEKAIETYDAAAEELPKLINDLHTEFVTDVFSKKSRIDLFWDDVRDDFFEGVYRQYNHTPTDFSSLSTNPCDIRWSFSKSGKLHLAFNLFLFTHPASFAAEINQDEYCRNQMALLLKRYYGFGGQFVIENNPKLEAYYKNGAHGEEP